METDLINNVKEVSLPIVDYRPAICSCLQEMKKNGRYDTIKGSIHYFKCNCGKTAKTKPMKVDKLTIDEIAERMVENHPLKGFLK